MTVGGGEGPLPRAHYHRYIRNGLGDLRLGCTVALFEPGTDDLVTQPVWVSSAGSTEHGAEWTTTTGVVDFYLDEAVAVDIVVTLPGSEGEKRFVNQWPGSTGGGGSGEVLSVNSQIGDVVLTAEDVGAIPAETVTRIEIIGEFSYPEIEPVNGTLYLVMPEVG